MQSEGHPFFGGHPPCVFPFSQDATVGNDCAMFGLLCAVLAGDCGMVRQLVALRADVHRKVFGLGEMGYYPGNWPADLGVSWASLGYPQ